MEECNSTLQALLVHSLMVHSRPACARTCAALMLAALLKADVMPVCPGSEGAGNERPGLRIRLPWRAVRGWGTSTTTPVLPEALPACAQWTQQSRTCNEQLSVP